LAVSRIPRKKAERYQSRRYRKVTFRDGEFKPLRDEDFFDECVIDRAPIALVRGQYIFSEFVWAIESSRVEPDGRLSETPTVFECLVRCRPRTPRIVSVKVHLKGGQAAVEPEDFDFLRRYLPAILEDAVAFCVTGFHWNESRRKWVAQTVHFKSNLEISAIEAITRRTNRSHPQETYELVAEAYRQAQQEKRSTVRAVAELLHYSEPHAKRMIRVARGLGLLEESTRSALQKAKKKSAKRPTRRKVGKK
jgi:hypothetical protein